MRYIFQFTHIFFFKGYDSANVSEFFLAGEAKDKPVIYDNTTNGVSGVQRVSESSAVNIVQRRKQVHEGGNGITKDYEEICENNITKANWKKIFLLIVAITVHNIPGIILCNMACHVNGRTRNCSGNMSLRRTSVSTVILCSLKICYMVWCDMVWYGIQPGICVWSGMIWFYIVCCSISNLLVAVIP